MVKMDEGKLENEKKSEGAHWTTIVCVKEFGLSVARRDRRFSWIK